AVHPQRLAVIALGRVVIFARRRRITEAQNRVAVGIVDIARLLVIAFGLGRIIGFQGVIPLLDQQPVSVDLQQAVPFAPVIALRIEGDRLFKLRNRTRAIAFLRIGLPQRAYGFTVGVVGADCFLQLRYRFTALPGIHCG